MKKLFCACLLLLFVQPNLAYSLEENVKACVKYRRADYSWSHGYKVTGFVLSGSELNSIARTYKYNSYNEYYVIPWKEGGYSALTLPFGGLSSFSREVEDQEQKMWGIKEGWDFCY